MDFERRILLLMPVGRDAAMTGEVLQRIGMMCTPCADVVGLCRELDRGAALVLIAEEAISREGHQAIVAWLDRQPRWSDLPLLLLARPLADSNTVAEAIASLRNVTVLERPLRVAALVSAVTSTLRARERQYELRAHLEHLEMQRRQLQDSDRRKDEFLALLAHELRNPLAPVRTALSLLIRRCADPATTTRLHQMMGRQIDTMVRLVDDLLDVSRFTRGKIVLDPERLDLRHVVERALETSQPLIAAAQHRLTVDLPPSAVWVRGDAIRLSQAFSNVLNNAAKYTPAQGEIRVQLGVEGGCACVSVDDSGIGVEPDSLEHVFDLFMQVREGRQSAQGGLGIGLTLVKGLVEQHGGTVTAHSDGAGKGSRFELRLPLDRAQDLPVTARAPRVRNAEGLHDLRVLVADDNRDAADSLALSLQQFGASVKVVYGGEKAANALLEGRSDVALLDIGMPGMDGYEVAQRVREARLHPGPVLIALTGWGQAGDRERSHAAGFEHHLVKPVALETLRDLLVQVRPAHAVGRH